MKYGFKLLVIGALASGISSSVYAQENWIPRGRVFDEAGTPVIGAAIEWRSAPFSWSYPELESAAEARIRASGRTVTDGTGGFLLPVSSRLAYVEVRVWSTGFARMVRRLDARFPSCEIVLDRGHHLLVALGGESSHERAEDATFFLCNAPPLSFPAPPIEVERMENGVYRLSHLPASFNEVEVHAPGWVPRRFREYHPSSPEPVRWTLERSATIRGRVFAHGGKPLAGASVAWMDVRDRRTSTPRDGSFELKGVHAAGGDRVTVSAPGYRSVECVTEGEGHDLLVELERLGAVMGRCVDAAGEPLSDVTITVWEVKGDQEVTTFWKVQDVAASSRGEPGSFHLSAIHHTGTYVLVVVSERDRPFVSPRFTGQPQGEVELGEIRAPPETRLAGCVLDPRGQPIPNAKVTLRVGLRAPLARVFIASMFQSIRGGWASERECVTDTEGRFEFAHSLGLPSVLRVAAEGFVDSVEPIDPSLHADEALRSLTVEMLPGACVRGGVQGDDGVAIVDATVTLQWTGPEAQSPYLRGLDDELRGHADLDDNFQIRHVTPGEYRVEMWPTPHFAFLRRRPHSTFLLTVVPGEDVVLEFGNGKWSVVSRSGQDRLPRDR